MKKLIATLLTLAMVISCVSMVCFAKNNTINSLAVDQEILTNPGFENGNTNGWDVSGDTITLVTDSANVHSGNYAAKYTKKSTNHWTNTPQYFVSTDNTIGRYEASCWIKNAGTESFSLYLSIKRNKEGIDNAEYSSSTLVTLPVGGDYQKLIVSFWMRPSDYVNIGFYWTGMDENNRSFYIDDCSFKKVVEASGDTLNDFSNYIRTSKTSVGAIRWDAYHKTNNSYYTVSNQVARTLSNYQDQAPFFVKQNDGYNSDYVDLKFDSANEQYDYVSMKSSNMETLSTSKLNYDYGVSWNEEAKYAMDAGLDYFAYLKYVSVDATSEASLMSLPMLAHIAKDGYLDDGRQMKMCCVFSNSQKKKAVAVNIDDYSTDLEKAQALNIDCKEIYLAMASSCYMTIPTKDGSRVAVMYYYDSMNTVREDIEIIKNQARFFTSYLASKNPEKYTPIDDIYFIAMDGNTQTEAYAVGYNYNGFSAVSRYSVSANVKEECDGYETETMDVYEFNNFTTPAATDVTVKSVSYKELTTQSMTYNQAYANVKDFIQCVPLSTAGRMQVPRVKVSTSWTDNEIPGSSGGHYGFAYTRKGTAQEIADHLRENIEWVQGNPDCTLLNSVLMYAWNEHDEGGWLCPTAVCDSDGKVIFDANGNATADTSILDAIKVVLDEYDNTATVKITSQNASTGATASAAYKKAGENTVDNGTFPDSIEITDISVGQTITLSATGDNFLGWYKTENSKNIFVSNKATVQIINNNQDEVYVAVYKNENDPIVTFKGLGGNTLLIANLNGFTANDIPNVDNSMSDVTFEGWMIDGQITNNAGLLTALQSKTEDVTVSARFTITGKATLTLNGEVKKGASGQFDKLSVVTVEAKETDSSSKPFSYWKYTDADGDHVLSSNRKYSFYITGDIEITPVYGESNDACAEVNITSVEKNSDKIVATIQRSVNKDYTVVEQGVLLTKNNGVSINDFTLGSALINDGVVICARSEGKLNNGVLIVTKLNVNDTENWRFRGYVVYKDNSGNIYTTYSNIK